MAVRAPLRFIADLPWIFIHGLWFTRCGCAVPSHLCLHRAHLCYTPDAPLCRIRCHSQMVCGSKILSCSSIILHHPFPSRTYPSVCSQEEGTHRRNKKEIKIDFSGRGKRREGGQDREYDDPLPLFFVFLCSTTTIAPVSKRQTLLAAVDGI